MRPVKTIMEGFYFILLIWKFLTNTIIIIIYIYTYIVMLCLTIFFLRYCFNKRQYPRFFQNNYFSGTKTNFFGKTIGCIDIYELFVRFWDSMEEWIWYNGLFVR